MTEYADIISVQGEEMTSTSPPITNSAASPQEMRDADVVALLLSRDEEALAMVLSRYGKLLHQLAARITGSDTDAEECVNDALLDLWNTVPPTRPPILLSYVSVLVRRRAIDRVRYNAAGRRGGLAYYSTLEELAECLPDGDGEQLLDGLVIRGCMTELLNGLSESDREIFLMRYFRFLTNEEIACAFGMRENTVATRLCRVRQRLRKILTKNGINV